MNPHSFMNELSCFFFFWRARDTESIRPKFVWISGKPQNHTNFRFKLVMWLRHATKHEFCQSVRKCTRLTKFPSPSVLQSKPEPFPFQIFTSIELEWVINHTTENSRSQQAWTQLLLAEKDDCADGENALCDHCPNWESKIVSQSMTN